MLGYQNDDKVLNVANIKGKCKITLPKSSKRIH